MDAKTIREAIEPAVKERGCFIVGVDIEGDNDITLTVESKEGVVEMEDCAALSDQFHALFDQDKEDYSLTVTSAGLDRPFRVKEQFEKAVGDVVEVRFKGGRKLIGVLSSFDGGNITLRYTLKEITERKKRKTDVEHEDAFSLSEINSVTPHIEFE